MKRLVSAACIVLALGACNDQSGSMKSLSPIPPKTVALMSEKGMSKSDAMLVRVYKKEAELEVWKKVDGHYAHLKTFPICRWSGQLGPKVREGDRQAPEGFYSVTPGQMNPNSSYYLSFDTGFPNAYDRAHNRSGSYLMVHGTCSSRGCYAMTDEGIAEVYSIARESFAGGQKAFQFQAYPFRMTAENLTKYRQDPHMPFWKNLKQGSDHFEVTKREPKVSVCQGRYAFNAVGDGCKDDPTLAPVIAQKDNEDRQQMAELVAKGVPAVRLVYSDGGQHEVFKSSGAAYAVDSGSSLAILDTRPRRNLGEVSRPDALAEGPREIALDGATKTPARPTALAFAPSKAGAKPAPPATASATGPKSAEPRRTVLANAGGGRDATASGSKGRARPQGSAEPLSRQVDAGRVLSGAASTGPSPSGFRTN